MYVDDDLGVSPDYARATDMSIAHSIMTDLLGPDAVATKKDDWGRRLVWLGWLVDLDTRQVTLSRKNALKSLHAFASCPADFRVTGPHVLRMATYASRASALHPILRPFTLALYRAHALFGTNPFKMRALSAPARADIALWRCVFTMFLATPTALSRGIESFRPRAPHVKIEYDASLTAVAAGVSVADGHGGHSLAAFTALVLPFESSPDSSYQNSYEYLAVVAGLLLARRLGLRDFTYSLHGDSVSSLQWTENSRATSLLARRANVGLALLVTHLQASVHDTVHVPGTRNVVYDGLSRGKSATDVGLDPAGEVTLGPTAPEAQYLRLCDPHLPLTTFAAYTALFEQCSRLLRSPAR